MTGLRSVGAPPDAKIERWASGTHDELVFCLISESERLDVALVFRPEQLLEGLWERTTLTLGVPAVIDLVRTRRDRVVLTDREELPAWSELVEAFHRLRREGYGYQGPLVVPSCRWGWPLSPDVLLHPDRDQIERRSLEP